jgi:hypothetical protein
MEGSTHPIVDGNQEIYPIYGNFRISKVQLPQDINFSGFRFINVKLSLLSLATITTQCAGSMCDRQNLYRNGRVEARCLCIANNQRMSSTTMVFHLRLRLDGQEDMVINNYTST